MGTLGTPRAHRGCSVALLRDTPWAQRARVALRWRCRCRRCAELAAHPVSNGEEWRADRVLLNKEVISPEGTRKFLPFLDTVARDFAAAMHRRMERTGRRSLTLDLHRDLFRFTLEGAWGAGCGGGAEGW